MSFQSLDQLSQVVSDKLDVLEKDMLALEAENERLRAGNISTYFERDACVSLIAKMARQLGLNVGTTANQVVVDLPSGQAAWEYLESEAHLFADLPAYSGSVEDQSIQDIYRRVMNPELG